MRKKYKFSGRTQSQRGIVSSVLGVCCWLLTLGAMYGAFISKGSSGKWIALVGFLALIVALVGLVCGVQSTKEEDVYPLLPWLGCALNGLIVAVYAAIYILGW